MRDPLWQAVYHNLHPMLDKADVVLAPTGDWPSFPCQSGFYRGSIAAQECTVLVLHKALLTCLPKLQLRRIAAEWQWIFANEVFIVFSRSQKTKRDARHTAAARHCEPLIRYLRSASLRRRRARIVYVHVPKTGGTSMWASLTRAFPSHVYYPSLGAYLSNPPADDEYDLIGIHFSPSVLLQSLDEEDWLIGMVRDPTQRFMSSVMHSRRAAEDPETFTPSAWAMRNMQLEDYLATEFGRIEARLQLITFGGDYRRSCDTLSEEDMLGSALSLARRDNVVLAPSERSHAFRNFVARRLCFRPGALGRLNMNEPALRAAHLPEFEAAVGLVKAMNIRERQFYDFVCRSFTERQTAGARRSKRPAGTPLSFFYASANMRAALG